MFWKLLNRNKFSIMAFVITLFLLAFFITENIFNYYNCRYSYIFKSTSSEVELVISKQGFDQAIANIDQYNQTAEKQITYAKIDYESMLDTAKLNKLTEDTYELSILRHYFPTTVKVSNGLVNTGDVRAQNYLSLIYSHISPNLEVDFISLEVVSYQNPYHVGLWTSLAGLLVSLILVFVFSFKVEPSALEVDNYEVYASVFHRSYWQQASHFADCVKKVCIISILLAVMMICKMLPIPSGFGSLGLGLTYIFFALIAWIYGPLCGLLIGFGSDILGYLFFQQGQTFFFGYTLNAMLSGFFYGICFYKKKLSFANCLLARLFVNMVVNVLLGSLWWKILYNLSDEAFISYLTLTSLPKNLIYLLPQSILLYVVFKALAVPLVKFGLISPKSIKTEVLTNS